MKKLPMRGMYLSGVRNGAFYENNRLASRTPQAGGRRGCTRCFLGFRSRTMVGLYTKLEMLGLAVGAPMKRGGKADEPRGWRVRVGA